MRRPLEYRAQRSALRWCAAVVVLLGCEASAWLFAWLACWLGVLDPWAGLAAVIAAAGLAVLGLHASWKIVR